MNKYSIHTYTANPLATPPCCPLRSSTMRREAIATTTSHNFSMGLRSGLRGGFHTTKAPLSLIAYTHSSEVHAPVLVLRAAFIPYLFDHFFMFLVLGHVIKDNQRAWTRIRRQVFDQIVRDLINK